MVTREEAIANASRTMSQAIRILYTYPLDEAARLAHVPGGPSIDELKSRIANRRDTYLPQAA